MPEKDGIFFFFMNPYLSSDMFPLGGTYQMGGRKITFPHSARQNFTSATTKNTRAGIGGNGGAKPPLKKEKSLKHRTFPFLFKNISGKFSNFKLSKKNFQTFPFFHFKQLRGGNNTYTWIKQRFVKIT
jgi:hypothetical protein